jgi:cyclopropane-fatty-acyl-phospholipid synthase
MSTERNGLDSKAYLPRGQLLSVTTLVEAATRHPVWVMEHLEDIGPHYARTLKDWRERFNKNSKRVRSLGFDEVFERKWNYYLACCEAGFRERALGDIQAVFRKPT